MAASVITLLAIKYNDRPIFYELRQGIPHSKGLPHVGNLPTILYNIPRHDDYNVELFDTLTLAIPALGVPVAVVTIDPRNIEHILRTFKNYLKGPLTYKNLKEILGRGIFSLNGERWRWQRKTASHIFNIKNFRDKFTDVYFISVSSLFYVCNMYHD